MSLKYELVVGVYHQTVNPPNIGVCDEVAILQNVGGWHKVSGFGVNPINVEVHHEKVNPLNVGVYHEGVNLINVEVHHGGVDPLNVGVPRETLRGGIPGAVLEPLVRSWSHFVGIYRQKLTQALRI